MYDAEHGERHLHRTENVPEVTRANGEPEAHRRRQGAPAEVVLRVRGQQPEGLLSRGENERAGAGSDETGDEQENRPGVRVAAKKRVRKAKRQSQLRRPNSGRSRIEIR